MNAAQEHRPIGQGQNVSTWASQWRPAMLRFARLHIQPDEEAEDAVQDALAAMLTASPDTLIGVDPRRYLFGILKHKITDRLRLRYRHEQHTVSQAHLDDTLDDTLFDAKGHWADGLEPATWQSPDDQMESDQFFVVVDLCVDKLPGKTAKVFSMKNFLDCEAEEICATLGLSKSDYWQCMSRARKQLQLCLTQRWFDHGAERPRSEPCP